MFKLIPQTIILKRKTIIDCTHINKLRKMVDDLPVGGGSGGNPFGGSGNDEVPIGGGSGGMGEERPVGAAAASRNAFDEAPVGGGGGANPFGAENE